MSHPTLHMAKVAYEGSLKVTLSLAAAMPEYPQECHEICVLQFDSLLYD